MKKSYSTVLALLIAATVGIHTTTAQADIGTAQETFDLLEKNPNTLDTIHQELFDTVIEQLTDDDAGSGYILDYNTPELMANIIKKHDYALQKFLSLLTSKNIRTNNEYNYSGRVIVSARKCRQVVVEIFTKLMNEEKLAPIIAKQLTPTIADVLGKNDQIVAIRENLGPLVDQIIIKHPPAISLFVSKAVNNIKKIPCQIIKILYKKAQGDDRKKLENAFKKININNATFFEAFIKHRVRYFVLKHHKKIKLNQSTQSEHHLHANRQAVKEEFLQELVHNKKVRKTFCRLHKKEKEEHKKGRYTFVHAQKWQWHFCADIFKKLWEIRYNEPVNDYQFLRFEPKSTNLIQETKKRERAMTEQDNFRWFRDKLGGLPPINWADRLAERLWKWFKNRINKGLAGRLFMNHAIFGNACCTGHSSAWYWLNNYDFSNGPLSVQNLLKKLNLQKYYKKYEKEFNQLQELHTESSTYGNMLLISLTPEQIKKCVIVANDSGHTEQITVDGKQTDNVKHILDALKSDPKRLKNSDYVQYCMMLTHDCALDPHNGPRIYGFNATNQEKFKQYTKLRDDTFNRIAHDVGADRKKQMYKKSVGQFLRGLFS